MSLVSVSFRICCDVRQGGTLLPFLFAIYVDDLINKLRQSDYDLYIGFLSVGCILYADDNIVLMPSSCYGLQKLVKVCTECGNEWDIKFNPEKSQQHLVVPTQRSPTSRLMANSSTEIWSIRSDYDRSLNVAWNNTFGKIFNSCWKESVKPLQFYCGCLPVSYLIRQRKLLF